MHIATYLVKNILHKNDGANLNKLFFTHDLNETRIIISTYGTFSRLVLYYHRRNIIGMVLNKIVIREIGH